jgi:hypothetical protein
MHDTMTFKPSAVTDLTATFSYLSKAHSPYNHIHIHSHSILLINIASNYTMNSSLLRFHGNTTKSHSPPGILYTLP